MTAELSNIEIDFKLRGSII